ncbi:MAG: D-glycero-beta-D-manno-heptose-1,7-bisphosphate 7-phosphatase [SAR86 cluster bacterium]|uniref:D,D-heptose 1,7-bisphosphate phosphatase n=1 Tax=SAR86 cluster bacterium TaxID=2030880 RepID=A0A2A5CK16_9GAMM|nr:D-glycero-beta-D-manno-heptose 1,7-bisphosphate 7-phosphatase [Gammaproteobacteria bacterium AH-315-E17]PCJ43851.1 MAG: D-glycero-beta-D-manno-heptose-1,7-bisphosphate 7-phosphatase [SAR86 cluster bacterium]
MPQTLVILDRDGVINHDSDRYIKSVEEWEPIPGSIHAIARLSQAGYKVVVATNQSGLARGYFDEITLANIHSYMCSLVENASGNINAIFYCPHGPDEGCSCRKPLPGMLNQIEDELNLSVENAFFIGDTEKDIDVALAKHCLPVLVRTGKGAAVEKQLSQEKKARVVIVDDLASAVDFILT